MEKVILINAKHPEEKRVAIVEDLRLTDFYVSISSAGHVKGNVYKGVITALEPGLQAAFVDIGQKKHGFLSLQDIMPENYKAKPKGKHPRIKEVLSKGQEMVVQVEHDPRGTKGARLTNYVSLPGRYLVIMPGRKGIGISRKIEDEKTRDAMKEAFKSLKVQKDMGFILRTAGMGRTAEELSSDLGYLTRLWNKIRREAKKAAAPHLVYKEEDIAVRTVRDYLTEDVRDVLVDDRQAFQNVKAFLKKTMPWRSINVTYYKEKTPLFDLYALEEQIAGLKDREVSLPSGGSLVIEKTEALTAVDINSARSREKNIEALALKTNLEAADEVARQLRLRDIGGLIVIDFIDMESGKNRAQVEEKLRAALSLDKAHYDITRISRFGMLEMSRERMRAAYFDATSRPCPTCAGAGVLKSPELVALAALRDAHSRASRGEAKELTLRLPVESANYLVNSLRESLSAVERDFDVRVEIQADLSLPPDGYSIEAPGAEKPGGKPEKPGKKAENKGQEEEGPKQTAPKKTRRPRRRKKTTTRKNTESASLSHAEEAPPMEAEPLETAGVVEGHVEEAKESEGEASPAKRKRRPYRRRRPRRKTAAGKSPEGGQPEGSEVVEQV